MKLRRIGALRLGLAILGTIAALALLFAAALFFGQRSLIYPAPRQVAPLPAGYERIELQTSDGLELKAAYRPASPGMPTIVFFHGNGDSWAGADVATRSYERGGYGVLLPEYRGYAGNPGSPSETGLYEDGRAALAWLHANGVGPSETIIIGNSIGSGVAVEMAKEFQPSRLVLISPFATLQRVASAKLPFLLVRMLLRDRFDNEAKIKDFNGRVLIVHGQEDQLIAPANSQILKQARPDARLVLVPHVGHELAYFPAAQDEVFEWLGSQEGVP